MCLDNYVQQIVCNSCEMCYIWVFVTSIKGGLSSLFLNPRCYPVCTVSASVLVYIW